jgi:hypothetical protein
MAPWFGQGKAYERAHPNSGDSFTGNGNVGRTLGLLAEGTFAAPLWQLCHCPCLPLTKGKQVWWVEIAGYRSVIP